MYTNYTINFIKTNGKYDGVEAKIYHDGTEENKLCNLINYIIVNSKRLDIESVYECFVSE